MAPVCLITMLGIVGTGANIGGGDGTGNQGGDGTGGGDQSVDGGNADG